MGTGSCGLEVPLAERCLKRDRALGWQMEPVLSRQVAGWLHITLLGARGIASERLLEGPSESRVLKKAALSPSFSGYEVGRHSFPSVYKTYRVSPLRPSTREL